MSMTPAKRAKMEKLIYDTYGALDKTGRNVAFYKEKFSSMTDAQFDKYFKDLFADEKGYIVFNTVEFEVQPNLETIEAAAKVLNVPLFENVTMHHLTMDKERGTVTPEPVPVGYLNIRRTQQTVSKKNGISIDMNKRQPLTGQVTGADKNGRESDIENMVLAGLELDNVMRELNGPRADDLVAKQKMIQAIGRDGYVTLEELPDDVGNKTTLNTTNVYLLQMGLNSDLVTTGLMLKDVVKEEL